MSYFYLGAYWPAERPLTLRQYADATRRFLRMLQEVHPVFRALEWVGDRPDSAISLSPDLSNLDDLIHRNAGYDDVIYQNSNPDGTLTWESTGKFGFRMGYGTGKSAQAGGISIAVDAGGYASPVPNSVSIGFPSANDMRFPYREFYEYEFLKKLFVKTVALWGAKYGRVTSHAFTEAITDERLPGVGWLTYVRDPRAEALRNSDTLRDLIFESVPDGGTLISLDTAIISPDNPTQVENARHLRSLLIAAKLV